MTQDSSELATAEPIAMELLAGCSSAQLPRVERLINGLPTLSFDPRLRFRDAAAIYRQVRSAGHTVRALNDCVIAAVAMAHDVVLLHKDRDFERIRAVTSLKTVAPDLTE